MALITRRSFIWQTPFAAALCACPLRGLDGRRWPFVADEQKGAPLHPEAIRKLASHIAAHVITPEDSEYDAARSVFNLMFNRRPGVIVHCAGPSDVARSVEFAQTKQQSRPQLEDGRAMGNFC